MKIFYFLLSFVFGITISSRAQTASLIINEVNANISNSCDLIELFVKTGGSVGGFSIEQGIGTPILLATFPIVTVSTGDLIVVHLNPGVALGNAPASETLGINQYPNASFSANYDGAWDFFGGTTGITYTNRVILVKDSAGTIQDAVPFSNGGATPVAFPPDLQSIQSQNLWLPVNCGGSPCDYVTTPTAQSVSVSWLGTGNSNIGTSVQRNSNTDNDNSSDWNNPQAQTWGLLNSGQIICTPTSSSISANACSSYTSPSGNHIWTSSGTYNDIIPNVAGCDSMITVNLIIKQTTSSSLNASICQGQSYLFNGLNRTTAGAYLDTLINAVGCDSIITLNLQVNPTIVTNISNGVCEGDSYFFNGQNITLAGSYSDTLMALGGCDSVVQLTLYTLSVQSTTIDTSILQGNNYTLPLGNVVTVAGTYRDTLTASNTCDSIVITNLSVITSVSNLTSETGSITINPNPATSQLFILINGATVTEINIYNTTGNLVSQTKQLHNNYIDISQLANGVYIAEMKTKERSVRRRWVKM